jgi:hypothetical protein
VVVSGVFVFGIWIFGGDFVWAHLCSVPFQHSARGGFCPCELVVTWSDVRVGACVGVR